MAQEFVELTIYPNKATKEDLKEVDRKAATVKVGTCELLILDSRITPPNQRMTPEKLTGSNSN